MSHSLTPLGGRELRAPDLYYQPSNSDSWTTTGNRVLLSVIPWRLALVLWRVNLGCASRKVSRRIFQLEVNRIDATVAVVNALGAQLDGLAIAGDYDVIPRVPRTAGVYGL